MGQYYKIVNQTKKEYLHPHKFDTGFKLLEWLGTDIVSIALPLLLVNSNGRGGGDINEESLQDSGILGSWAGDNIVISGDYNEETDKGYVDWEDLENYTDISDKLLNYITKLKTNYTWLEEGNN